LRAEEAPLGSQAQGRPEGGPQVGALEGALPHKALQVVVLLGGLVPRAAVRSQEGVGLAGPQHQVEGRPQEVGSWAERLHLGVGTSRGQQQEGGHTQEAGLEGWQGGCRAEQREGGHRGQEGELLELGPPSISAHSPSGSQTRCAGPQACSSPCSLPPLLPGPHWG